MRKFYVLLAMLMVVSLVLTACAQPTAAPVVEEPEAPAGEEPVVQPTAEVIEVVLNPYLGSNKLDGNGIPRHSSMMSISARLLPTASIIRPSSMMFTWVRLFSPRPSRFPVCRVTTPTSRLRVRPGEMRGRVQTG